MFIASLSPNFVSNASRMFRVLVFLIFSIFLSARCCKESRRLFFCGVVLSGVILRKKILLLKHESRKEINIKV